MYSAQLPHENRLVVKWDPFPWIAKLVFCPLSCSAFQNCVRAEPWFVHQKVRIASFVAARFGLASPSLSDPLLSLSSRSFPSFSLNSLPLSSSLLLPWSYSLWIYFLSFIIIIIISSSHLCLGVAVFFCFVYSPLVSLRFLDAFPSFASL